MPSGAVPEVDGGRQSGLGVPLHESDLRPEHTAVVAGVRGPLSGRTGDGLLDTAALAQTVSRRRTHTRYVHSGMDLWTPGACAVDKIFFRTMCLVLV